MPVLAGIGPLGIPELIIIAFIVILVFGVGRLPEVGGAVGRGIREFRKATRDGEEEDGGAPGATAASALDAPRDTAAPADAAPAAEDAVLCGECGTKNGRSAKFCSSCGHALTAAVS